MKGFLYGQTEYNILASANRLVPYVNKAKECNFDYLSITDKSMHAAYKFYKLAKENNIKPIIGIEYGFNFGNVNNSKVLLYAKNNNGFKNLLKISSLVETEDIDTLDDINDYSNDLIFIFVFDNSILEELLISKEYSMLNDLLNIIKSYNGYIGISNTNYVFKEAIHNEILSLSNRFGIDIIPVHKCNYLNKDDYKIYETLRAIDGEKEEVLVNDFSFIENPISDSILDNIVSSIELSIYDEKPRLPKFPNTKGMESKEYLKMLCEKGLSRRLSLNHIGNEYHKMYYDRLTYELDVISKMGYDDYFLIVWDFIRYSKQNDILVGPGRGSAAGSLVAYVLGITEINPLSYGLFFERFLNPERISMPDIDTDFPDDKRDMVISYVKSLYGKYHVCNITAFGSFKLKSSIKDLARILKYDVERAKKIVDMVEKYGFDYLINEYENRDEELVDFLKIAKGLEDLPRHISTHAAGIILSDKRLDDIIPLSNGVNDLYQSQYEAKDLEEIGLLKMDFLSLSNLSMIYGMMKDSSFDVNKLRNIPLDDPKVYKLLSSGDTLGLFQLESKGIRDVLIKLKPTCFMDLVATLALYRPGPMDNIPDFINGKHGAKVNYLHPDLEPILKETYGVIVYQEQIMQIAQKIAGFSLGEADLLRRAISKKDSSKLVKLEKDFIDRSVNRGYDYDTSKKIYDLIFKFANYGFNKSHSVAYAYVTYQMAYFKVNYFPVFMSNIFNNVISQSETLSSYIRYAKLRGLKIYKPNINISTNRFMITKEGLFIPFTAIKSIGELVSNKIIEARNKPFTSYDDFRDRTSFLTSENNMALIFSGALDMFGKTKKSMCENTDSKDVTFFKYMNVKDNNEEYDIEYLREMENKYLGFNLEYDVLNGYYDIVKKNKLVPLNRINNQLRANTLVHFVSFSEKKTKANDKMLIGTIEDDKSSYHFVVFPDDYKKNGNIPSKDKLYIVVGQFRLNKNNENDFVIYEYFEAK